MTPAFLGMIIGATAVVAFFAGSGRRSRWWLTGCSLLFLALGLGGGWLIQKGPQKFFEHASISVPHQAWAFNTLTLIGLGGLAGMLVRGGLAMAKRF